MIKTDFLCVDSRIVPQLTWRFQNSVSQLCKFSLELNLLTDFIVSWAMTSYKVHVNRLATWKRKLIFQCKHCYCRHSHHDRLSRHRQNRQCLCLRHRHLLPRFIIVDIFSGNAHFTSPLLRHIVNETCRMNQLNCTILCVIFFSQVNLIKILILDYIFGICSPTNDETDKTISVFFTGCFTDFEMAYVK